MKSIVEIIGEEIQNNQNFQQWFGQSKVVDRSGKPLKVYHGTQSDFNSFKSETGLMYFSKTPKYASQFATNREIKRTVDDSQPSVMPVYLSIQKPLDLLEFKTEIISRYEFGGKLDDLGIEINSDNLKDYPMGLNMGEDVRVWQWLRFNAKYLLPIIKASGYDGIFMYEHAETGGKTIQDVAYVIFEPTQAKSATGNNGEYDRSNPDITKEDVNEYGIPNRPIYQFDMNGDLINTFINADDAQSKLSTSRKEIYGMIGRKSFNTREGYYLSYDKNFKAKLKSFNRNPLLRGNYGDIYGDDENLDSNSELNEIIWEEISKFNKSTFSDVPDEIFQRLRLRKFSDDANRSHMKVFKAKDGREYIVSKSINQDVFRINTLDGQQVAVAAFDEQPDYFSGYESSQSIQVQPEYRRLGLATAITDFAETIYNKPYKPTKLLSEPMQGFVQNRFNPE